MTGFARWILKYAGWIVALGILLSGVGLHYSILLYKNLRTDIEELLPTTARSVIDLNEVTRRLESIDNLAILMFTQDAAAGRRFQDALGLRLKEAPREVIASVEYRIDRELQFFEARRALFLELGDLTRIRDYIRDRIDFERQLYNPLNIFNETELPEPVLDFNRIKKKYEGQTSAYSRFPDGYYATPDGTQRVILVNIPGGSGIEGAKRLKARVDDAIQEVEPLKYAPDLKILFTGGVQNNIEEQAALVADLELSTVLVTVLVALAMWVFFRAFRASIALMMALFMGTLWTFGLSYFAVGYLNANSAFLGSIIIGNGINAPIIYLARYLEERRKSHSHAEATVSAYRGTTMSTLTASLAAGLAYGSLYLTEFRGFKQFGVIGLTGMVLCWISAYTMLPALLTVMDRHKPIMTDTRGAPKAWIAGRLANLIQKHPRAIWITAIVLSVASLLTFSRYSSDILETDLTKLRNKVSMERGSGYLSRYVDEIFQRYLSPLVVLPHSREEAGAVAEALRKLKADEGDQSLIASVQTIDQFVPADQDKKIRVLREIQELLPPRLLNRMGADERKRVEEFMNPAAFKPIRMEDLPGLVLEKFTERDGSIGKMVLVEPPLRILNGEELPRLVGGLRKATDSVAPGAPVAGALPISADMLEAISRDGPKATLFAFLAVIGLVTVLFRSLRTISLVLFSLILGMLWLTGLVLGFGIKINFLNFIALPITFGIGVDYGVNIFQRYREEGGASIIPVIRDTGGAVILCSFTTVVGYGSLLIADNQAFVSFGLLSVLGEMTCLFAAVICLPAFLILRQRKAGATA